jgi:hypothetical protein
VQPSSSLCPYVLLSCFSHLVTIPLNGVNRVVLPRLTKKGCPCWVKFALRI